jgi:alkylhydroperoxidase family enzyme
MTATTGESAVPRIPYADLTHRAEDVRKVFEASGLNMIRMLANASDEVFVNFNRFASTFFIHSKLPADLREIAVLRAGYLVKASYETTHHEAISRDLGMTEAQLAAVKQGGNHPGVLNDAQQAVLDFADDFILNARVSETHLDAVRKHLSDQQLMDLMFVTGVYMTVSRILETTGVPFDDRPIDNSRLQSLAKTANL